MKHLGSSYQKGSWLAFLAGVCCTLVIAAVLLFNQHHSEAGDTLVAGFRTQEEQRTIDVYRTVNEAVVFITTVSLTVDPFDLFEEVTPRQGTGSGVIIDAREGLVLTNHHVVGDASKIEITLADGQNYRARLVGLDKESDIAVLRIQEPPSNLVAIKFADSSRPEVGQKVLAIGNPFGLNRTLTTGIISSLHRSMRSPSGGVMRGLIQTDAAINPGNSGGPLLDLDGKMLGLNTAILSQSGDSAGIGFAVPSNHLRKLLPELISTGRVLRPKMGWVLMDTEIGPFVLRLLEGGPAARAGVQPLERIVKDMFLRGIVRDPSRADLVVKVNGKRVTSSEEIEDIVANADTNEAITLTLRTGGSEGPERSVRVMPQLK